VDGGEFFCETSSSTAAISEQGEPQPLAILDEPAGCASQPLLCPVELPSCNKSATAACSPNRTSGPYACSIPALELSSLCLGSCTPTAAQQSSRSPGRQRQWRRNVASCESRLTVSWAQVIPITALSDLGLATPDAQIQFRYQKAVLTRFCDQPHGTNPSGNQLLAPVVQKGSSAAAASE
jgi:hypothetical protein